MSVIVMVPVRLPAAVGVKVTEIVQLVSGATPSPQAFVSAKSPEMLIEVMASMAFPLFVSVTVCDALVELVACAAKVRLVGDTVAAGRGVTPVPLSGTV